MPVTVKVLALTPVVGNVGTTPAGGLIPPPDFASSPLSGGASVPGSIWSAPPHAAHATDNANSTPHAIGNRTLNGK
jgi:hypothetical protein